MLMQTEKQPNMCPTLDKSFPYLVNSKSHMLIHESERPQK